MYTTTQTSQAIVAHMKVVIENGEYCESEGRRVDIRRREEEEKREKSRRGGGRDVDWEEDEERPHTFRAAEAVATTL